MNSDAVLKKRMLEERRREQKEFLFVYDNVIHSINGKKVLRANDEGDLRAEKWIINGLMIIARPFQFGQLREIAFRTSWSVEEGEENT